MRGNGMSARAIARALGISKDTAAKHCKQIESPLCECGRPVGREHGWCKSTYAKSIARQAFQASRRGVHIAVPPPPVVPTRVSKERAERLRWLGRIDWSGRPPNGSEVDPGISAISLATRRVYKEQRDEVRQEMALAFLEGRLAFDDIRRSVSTFVHYVWHGCSLRYEVPIDIGAKDAFGHNNRWEPRIEPNYDCEPDEQEDLAA